MQISERIHVYAPRSDPENTRTWFRVEIIVAQLVLSAAYTEVSTLDCASGTE